MGWSLKRMFGRTKPAAEPEMSPVDLDRYHSLSAKVTEQAATIAEQQQVIARRDDLALGLAQEMAGVRNELAAERRRTSAARVQYARACTDVDTERRLRITAEADVKELTGQREDQAARIEELERERRIYHVPVVEQGSEPGTWAVCCHACSDKANVHVWPCAVGWAEMVPKVLVAYEGSEK